MTTMTFQRPALPYELDALQKFVSKETMDYHYNKHHEAYYKKLNALIEGKPESKWSLEEIVKKSSGGIFNNAAQAWNHNLFWTILAPSGGGKPSSTLLEAIHRDFGDFDSFKSAFSNAAANLFGSGWAWLATNNRGKLEITALSNGENPLPFNKRPILGLDVWEHAYYIDYRNRRPDYIEAFWNVINWENVEKYFLEAQK